MAEVLTIDGDFDAAAARELRPQIEKLALAAGDVTVDMAGVEFVDSSGVGALVFLHKRLLEAGHRLKVTGLRGQPLELLTYLRLADKLV
jgi:anti-sigma B factor antagonist